MIETNIVFCGDIGVHPRVDLDYTVGRLVLEQLNTRKDISTDVCIDELTYSSVTLVFPDVRSIDVVIRALNRIKECICAEKTTEEEPQKEEDVC